MHTCVRLASRAMTEIASSTLFCSIEANVMGIMFYEGLAHLRSLQQVQLERDYSCLHDTNAIWAKIVLRDRAVVLGHVESRVAAALAPMMDACIHGLIIRRYYIIDYCVYY